MVPFLSTKGVLSSERFDVLPPFVRVSFSQTVHFAVIIRGLPVFIARWTLFRHIRITERFNSHILNMKTFPSCKKFQAYALLRFWIQMS